MTDPVMQPLALRLNEGEAVLEVLVLCVVLSVVLRVPVTDTVKELDWEYEGLAEEECVAEVQVLPEGDVEREPDAEARLEEV